MKIKTVICLFLFVISPPILAAFEPSAVDALGANKITSIPEIKSAEAKKISPIGVYNQQARRSVLLPGEVDIRQLLPSSAEALPPPYGANLFAGGYESERADGLNDNYLIAAGDKINIWIWGAISYSDLVTVDNQGNIFIPKIGPINVLGVKASNVNKLVSTKIKSIYTNNINVYVNLLTSTPVSVYLSGPVIRPGQYAGMASDSLLYFLKRAGGIDSERGSYREILVLRNNKIIANIDLYEFVQKGTLPNINFKDKDIILVKPQKSAINVSGAVRNPFRFELEHKISTGRELAGYARPFAKISHVGVFGDRKGGPFSVYLTVKNFQNFELKDGDSVVFNADLHTQVIDVKISGSYMGPSYFVVNNTTRLHDLLSRIPINPELTDYKSIYILRKSVAQRQKQLLNDSLDRLERSIYTAPISSDSAASIRAKEAEMVMRFVEKARKIEPLGKVIVSDNGITANILLEKGDQVVIPHYTDLIQVAGEVLMPQAVVFNKDARIDDYIAWAGGFTNRAEDHKISIVRANGIVVFDPNAQIRPGDQIIVIPKVEAKTMQTVKDITQIMYQIAIAANVVLK
ncbi:capsular polysaccharide export system periplasmic protein KpsD [Psychromonas sp. CNPT3]|uniref:polysaccharide biosynthesis/export family protein n=1 Tax=Psychromonas sp. CNPT3 TaxID=314282 RepID=UPI0002C120A8|nr:polysaccharide biosynthesis/export family protein [Psychromonas sp. CNPT3]AGH81029.1 capsular polysaccharide export system periplasmic protein KpsD [Psychromonas sp. CNPT3]